MRAKSEIIINHTGRMLKDQQRKLCTVLKIPLSSTRLTIKQLRAINFVNGFVIIATLILRKKKIDKKWLDVDKDGKIYGEENVKLFVKNTRKSGENDINIS